jgi:hypothetical protein
MAHVNGSMNPATLHVETSGVGFRGLDLVTQTTALARVPSCHGQRGGCHSRGYHSLAGLHVSTSQGRKPISHASPIWRFPNPV